MIIFVSILTTFDLSNVFEVAGAVVKIGSSLKPNHYEQLSLSKSVKYSEFTLNKILNTITFLNWLPGETGKHWNPNILQFQDCKKEKWKETVLGIKWNNEWMKNLM